MYVWYSIKCNILLSSFATVLPCTASKLPVSTTRGPACCIVAVFLPYSCIVNAANWTQTSVLSTSTTPPASAHNCVLRSPMVVKVCCDLLARFCRMQVFSLVNCFCRLKLCQRVIVDMLYAAVLSLCFNMLLHYYTKYTDYVLQNCDNFPVWWTRRSKRMQHVLVWNCCE